MSVKESMKNIDRAVEEEIGTHERYESKKEGKSQRRAYEQSLEEVEDLAGKAEAKRLAEWIETQIRETGKLPKSRRVRNRGAKICREAGHSVSTNDWLGA